jgi:hypothetical protein
LFQSVRFLSSPHIRRLPDAFIEPDMSARLYGRDPFDEADVQAMVQAVADGTDGRRKVPGVWALDGGSDDEERSPGVGSTVIASRQ